MAVTCSQRTGRAPREMSPGANPAAVLAEKPDQNLRSNGSLPGFPLGVETPPGVAVAVAAGRGLRFGCEPEGVTLELLLADGIAASVAAGAARAADAETAVGRIESTGAGVGIRVSALTPACREAAPFAVPPLPEDSV